MTGVDECHFFMYLVQRYSQLCQRATGAQEKKAPSVPYPVRIAKVYKVDVLCACIVVSDVRARVRIATRRIRRTRCVGGGAEVEVELRERKRAISNLEGRS